MNYFKILFMSLALAAATDTEDQWVHAELRYSSHDRLTPELEQFFKTQPHIPHKIIEDLEHIELHIFKKTDKVRASNKLFVEHMPLALAKDSLSEKGLLNEAYSDL